MTTPNAPAKIAVLGCGSWGSTIAAMLHRNGLAVRLWSHSEEELRRLKDAGHPPGVPELRLPDMPMSHQLSDALTGIDAAVFVIPAQAVNSVCEHIRAAGLTLPVAIIASKGIDLQTLRPLSDVVNDYLPRTTVAVVSGPCIAREVAQGIPTSVVAACADDAVAGRVQHWFNSQTFRVYRQSDVLGVEYGGAYKNVIAIAAGACDGLGFGANSKSALLTRGLAEMRRFVLSMGAQDLTIMGLAGLGDLCVTCFSPHSRNRRFGEAMGKGIHPMEAISQIGEVVEGVSTAEAVVRLSKERNIDTPIALSVTKVVSGEWSARETVTRLMTRELKDEF